MQPPTDVLSSSQAAAIFGVSAETIRQWAESGKLAGFRTPGGHWRFRRDDIAALIDNVQKPTRKVWVAE